MTKPKARTALAKFLDTVSNNTESYNADVVSARTEELIPKNPSRIFISNTSSKNENDTLLKLIDPNLCRPWQFADRPDDEMGDIDRLTDSMKENGQQEPVLVRPVTNQQDIKFEVIFGNRRWRAAKRAGIDLLAIIKDVSDQQAALFQKEENENRKDLSDLARARSYQALIEGGIFKSEIELSKNLGISKQNLNDIMSFNRIPEKLASAIPNLNTISRKTAVKISILAKDDKKLEKLISLAGQIGSGKINSNNIEDFLDSYDKSNLYHGKNFKQNVVESVINKKGIKLFTLKTSKNGEVTIKISKSQNGNYDVTGIKEMLLSYLSENK